MGAVTEEHKNKRKERVRGKGERFSVLDDGEGIQANYALDAATLAGIAERERMVDVPMIARLAAGDPPTVNPPIVIDDPEPVGLTSLSPVKETQAPAPSPSPDFSENREQMGSESVANREQIGSQPIANRERIGSVTQPIPSSNDTGSESVANQEQTDSKPVAKSRANRERIGSKLSTPKNRIGSKSVAQSVAESVANREQVFLLPFLRGVQRDILDFIYSECRADGSLTTRPIQGRELAKAGNCAIGVAKNARNRLKEKGVIILGQSCAGALGSTIYELPKRIYDDLLREENRARIGSKSVAESVAESVANAPCSSSSKKENTKTTTTEQPVNPLEGLPVEWLSFDYEELKPLGFGQRQIAQAYRALGSEITPDIFQVSLHGFAWDYKKKKLPHVRNPMSFLMGIIAKGGPYAPTEDFYTHRRKAVENVANQMRIRQVDFKAETSELYAGLYELWKSHLAPEAIAEIEQRRAGEDDPLGAEYQATEWAEVKARYKEESAK